MKLCNTWYTSEYDKFDLALIIGNYSYIISENSWANFIYEFDDTELIKYEFKFL